jgi:hypothetical protein
VRVSSFIRRKSSFQFTLLLASLNDFVSETNEVFVLDDSFDSAFKHKLLFVSSVLVEAEAAAAAAAFNEVSESLAGLNFTMLGCAM